jgi:nucleoside-diphosphate-sugar epimerase
VPESVLILGAGWLGQPLADAFAADGARVTTVRRTPHEPPTGGAALAADLRDLADPVVPLPDALRTHDVVITLVAPDRRRGDDHAGTYPTAARAAVRLARAAGARALCWISSTGVYGYTDGREVTESTPLAATDAPQRALIDAEAIVRMADAAAPSETRHEAPIDAATEVPSDTPPAAPDHALVAGVLRVAGLYGPGRDPAGRYRDPATIAMRGDQWVNLAWRDDVIAAIRCWVHRALTAAPADVPRVVNVADGTPLLVSECAALVARADGRPVAALAPVAPPTTDATRPVTGRSNQRIRVDTLRALGWRPQVPTLREGLLALGYDRLRDEPLVYGPQTAEIRRFLQRVATSDANTRARIVAAWQAISGTAALHLAERALGETIARSGREAERDAAAGPLLQMLRTGGDASPTADAPTAASPTAASPTAASPTAASPTDAASPAGPSADGAPADATAPFDPVILPVLGALMALVVRDVLPPDRYETLTAPVRPLLEPPR